jgi:hypothetical protein
VCGLANVCGFSCGRVRLASSNHVATTSASRIVDAKPRLALSTDPAENKAASLQTRVGQLHFWFVTTIAVPQGKRGLVEGRQCSSDVPIEGATMGGSRNAFVHASQPRSFDQSINVAEARAR